MLNSPILEPNLNRSLRHIDFLGDTFPNAGSWRGIFVELNLKEDKLILSCPLAFLVLLLLSESALSRRST